MTNFNSLLVSGAAAWGNSAAGLTYSFLQSVPAYYQQLDQDGDGVAESYLINSDNDTVTFDAFAALSELQQELARAAIDVWDDVANIKLTEISGIGDITWGALQFDDQTFGFVSDFPGTHGQPAWGGDLWLNNAMPDQAAALPGNTGFQTYIHELGHALGLHHPDEDPNNEGGAPTNNNQWTVMSYVAHPDQQDEEAAGQFVAFPITPMIYDIQAIQALYGVNTTTRAGNTNYFAGAGAYLPLLDGGKLYEDVGAILTVWDAGGVDTINASNQTSAVQINLAPGTFSTIGAIKNNIGLAAAVTVNGKVINYIENAIGGSANDTLAGNAANNVLDGRRGADVMDGKGGNDIYIVDNAGDRVMETSATGGVDLVKSSVSFNLAGQYIEQLTLTGSASITAAGNQFRNILVGNGAANVLDGKGGADVMQGGRGNDTFIVDHTGDKVIEGAGQGVDQVKSSVSFNLAGQDVEQLILTGSGNIAGTGNALGNSIIGNGGSNVLDGGAGADTLQGGKGRDILLPGNDAVRDTLVFNSPLDSTGLTRDEVRGMDLNGEDKFHFAVTPTALLKTVAGGLSGASFDDDIADLVDGVFGEGGAIEAILINPNRAGHLYLVLDADNDGAYTAGDDYVVQLVNSMGRLDLSDFV